MLIRKSATFVFFFILLGRLTGFIREWLLTAIGGANENTDIAVILFTFPDLIVNILLAGGLSKTLIPYLQTIQDKKKKEFIFQISFFIFILFLLISLFLCLNTDLLWSILSPGIENKITKNANINLVLIIFCIPIAAITGVCNSYLNSQSKFKVAASGTILFNGGIILGLFLDLPLLWRISIGVILGSFLRLIFQLSFTELIKSIDFKFKKNLIKKNLIYQFLFNFSFVSSLILLPTFGRSWASTIGEGNLSLFSYSTKIIELPLGLIIGSLTTVLITKLANNISTETIIKAIRFVFLSSIFISFVSISFAPQIVKTIYFKGSFDQKQLEELISITRIGFLFFTPQALVSLFSTIFSSAQKAKYLAPVGLTIIITGNLFLFKASISGSLQNIMYGYGLNYLIACIILYFMINLLVDDRVHKQLIPKEFFRLNR